MRFNKFLKPSSCYRIFGRISVVIKYELCRNPYKSFFESPQKSFFGFDARLDPAWFMAYLDDAGHLKYYVFSDSSGFANDIEKYASEIESS